MKDYIKIVKENYLLLLIVVFGSILRFYHVDFQSIWLDEIHTINEANPNVSFREIYDLIIKGEQMPPLYFYSVYFLFKLFGYSTFVLRLYSAVVGIVGVIAIFLLGKELINKRTGLIAALLLSVNYFHIFYSQEGRPYVFLFLFTTLAFLQLIKFLKTPTRKYAIFYAITAALMIYSHFFGLLALFAQYLILLFFFLIIKSEKRKAFLINSIISVIITLLIFLPAVRILLRVTDIKQFWISPPTLDVYTQIFSEFFGKSEIILPIISVITIFYFIKLANQSEQKFDYLAIVENKILFSFVILIIWIIPIIIIPLIRSYTSAPMLISRYFINLLPAILIIIAIGINEMKSIIFRVIIVSTLIIFSVTDILIVKNYYQKPAKAQFRDATNYIKSNNKNNHPIVTSLGWYLPFFFSKTETNIVDKTLELHISEMMQDSTKIKPFWYFDAHGRIYNPSKQLQMFIDKNFYVENNYDGIDVWTKHFILSKDVSSTIDISKFMPFKERNGDEINYTVDNFSQTETEAEISGWTFFPNQSSINTKIRVVLIKDTLALNIPTQMSTRNDVTLYYKNQSNLDNSGFNAKINLLKLPEGSYKIGLSVKNEETKKESLIVTDKYIEK